MKANSERLTVQDQLGNLLEQLNEIEESLKTTQYYDEKFNNQLADIIKQYGKIELPAKEKRTQDIVTQLNEITTQYRELKNTINKLPEKTILQKFVDYWNTPTPTPQPSSVKQQPRKLQLAAEQVKQQQIKQDIQTYKNLANELQNTENLEHCNAAYMTYSQHLIKMQSLESRMDDDNQREWETAKTEHETDITNVINSFLSLSQKDIQEKINVIKSNFEIISNDSRDYIQTSSSLIANAPANSLELVIVRNEPFILRTHEDNKLIFEENVNATVNNIDFYLLLPITTLNKNHTDFLTESKIILEDIKVELIKIKTIEERITQLNQESETSFSSLMTALTNALPIGDVSLESIQTERTLEHTNLSEKVSGFINGTTDETVDTLKERARLLLERVTKENNRIAILSRKPSNTQPSFLEALKELRTKSLDLKQRDNGAENSLEWDAHRQLETLITGLTRAEETYITAVADPLVVAPVVETPEEPEIPVETPAEPAVETPAEPVAEIPVETPAEPAVDSTAEPTEKTALELFQETCNELISNLDKTIINQNRGWSIARVLDNITSAIDALIDVVYQNAPNTTKTVYNFFHHSPTTKTQVDNLEEAVRTFGAPAA
jgi:hypothetical protein